MLDGKTGSVWSHLDGLAVSGEMQGRQLEIQPLLTTYWSDWVEQHPDTTVTDIDTKYSDRYRNATALGRSGLGQSFIATLDVIDKRLPESELVIGVLAGSGSMAFPVAQGGDEGLMQADVGGVPVVILEQENGLATLAYHRALTDGTVLNFVNDGSAIIDENTGTVWNSDGLAIEGPLEGVQLIFVTSFFTEWYGWAAFHPDTTIFGVDG